MNPKHDDRSSRLPRWLLSLLLALAIQGALLGLLYLAMNNPFPEATEKAIELLSFEEEAPLPEVKPADQVQEPPLQEIPGTETPLGQLVDLPQPKEEVMPEKASWSARYAMKVKNEVKARLLGPTLRAPSDRNQPEAKGQGSGPQGPQDQQGDKASDQPAAQDEGQQPQEASGQQSLRAQDALKDGFGPSSLGRDPFDNVKQVGRRDASDDELIRVGAGEDETALNAMPYRYIGFFERVKDAVRQQWDPNRVYGPRDPTGSMFGYKDRMTVLKVVLDRKGKLLDATVVSGCGLGFLDDEAKRAMWAASPFTNPPEGLVAADGRIRFEFGFVFLLSSAKHRLFWRME